MKPQPIPRALADKIAALWDEQQAAYAAFSEAWNALAFSDRDPAKCGDEILRLAALRDEVKKRANSATDDLSRDFHWLRPAWVAFDGLSGSQFCACVATDYGDALNRWFVEENGPRITGIITAWNRLKGQEQTSPPVRGWALNVRTQQAFKILHASPTGRKVRAVGVDGVVVDLKPCVVHGSSVGSGRAAPSSGGWVSIPETMCEEVWALRRDRDKMHAENPAIV